MFLVSRQCELCGDSVTVTNEHKEICFCQRHMQKTCCMAGKTDLWGRSSHCNTTVPVVCRIEKNGPVTYCQSHWKTKQSRCHICGRESTCLGYDRYGYCNFHKPNTFERNRCIQEVVPYEVSDYVTTLVGA